MIHFDSSQYNKVGIGVGFKEENTNSSPYLFEEHAKLHIRHIGGTGSNVTNQKGPHLLLDEATADRVAVIRFRQSTIETNELGKNSLVPGARYWDIRGFANSTSPIPPWGDEMLFVNSGLDVPVLSLAGTASVGINKQVPESTLHVNGDALIQNEISPISTLIVRGTSTSSIELGESGQTTGYGEISYDMDSDALSIWTNKDKFGLKMKDNKVAIGGNSSFNPNSTLDVHGFTNLGENSPKIKTELLNIIMPSAASATSVYSILPVDASKIIRIEIIVEDDDVSPSRFYNSAAFYAGARFSFYFTGLDIYITTLGQDISLSGNIGNDPAKVYITYIE
ncbi:hypothetical protein EGI22_10435 [Lacihabitans sp. LS3-19]|uniref:hypothetical protein n=1 Tax=Lacihabitans sp. LS3-19 TaxID=2487335 RepID=UPI0020CEF187|nr:hypothetical protein [Lacihabitans sp. LS3-19]MCP9768331.1 hypothetical protein [Lacihabitans sp. LS3-19]